MLGFLVIHALPGTYAGALLTAYSDSLLAVCGAGFFCLPLWGGLVHGRRAPKRGGIGMFAALSVVVAVGSALFWVSTETGLDRTALGGLFTSLPLMAAAWMPTACPSAALAGWRTRRAKTRQLA